ncbi:phosphatase PAP2 family protein [Lichenihabitans sp. PAMC28606]|uniref:phosphatase PAP2 family protein n=1 Tax=Lichenihabitans sp. PAMC28606 TaxID=2880932 RepID=UPI001D09E31C|nr:phosphatase PAP2 family protein [Lichenihabitans sp. PAMC28606]UDL94622.1 phosphatase PAP2 family protein [Lichenihabitans sp. PAMC28606]
MFLICLLALVLIDQPVAIWAAHLSPRVVRAGFFVTWFGTSGYMFLASALVALAAFVLRRNESSRITRERLTLLARRAVFFVLAIAVSGLAVQGLKHIIGRARPRLIEQLGAFSLHPFSWPNDFASFPSGHTTSAFAAATALALMMPRARWGLLVCAVAIGISRVVVNAHYPSDVLAGAALGTSVTLLLARSMVRRGLALFPQSARLSWSSGKPG